MRIVWVIAIYTVYGRKLIDDNMTMQYGYKRCEFILSKGWADGYYDILTNPHHFLYKKTLKQLEMESKKYD